MNRPRILTNLSWMQPGRVGGSEEYSTRLLGTLTDPGQGPLPFEVTVAAADGVFRAHPCLAELARYRVGRGARWRPVRLAMESTTLARESRHHDLVHHFGGRLPALRGAPAVVTVHDIQPLDLPQYFSPAKRRYLQWAIPRTIRSARLVITPSRWVAERLIERFGIDDRRLRVVPSTFAPSDRQGPAAPSGTGPEPTGSEPHPVVASLGSPLIVYPAMTHPHKDHQTLLRAFVAVRARFPDVTLVLTGSPGRSHAAVQQLVDATPGARHLGRVDPDVLNRLIVRADVLAFPSRYEGFGLPVLEAMRAGTPVVAAAATALPEVLGGGGHLVGPGDVEAWAEALSMVLDGRDDPETRRAAEARVDHYSPSRARARLLEAWTYALDTA